MSCQRCWTKTLLQWALFSQAEHCNDHTCTMFSVSEQGIHCESEAKYKGNLQTATNSLASHQILLKLQGKPLYLRGSYSIHGNSLLENYQEVTSNVRKGDGRSINALPHLSRKGETNVRRTQSVTLLRQQVSTLQQSHHLSQVYTAIEGHRPQHQELCFWRVLIFP